MMVGDDMDQTIISGSHSNTTSYGTYGSATFGNLNYQHAFHFLCKISLEYILGTIYLLVWKL